jgi:hypothetical protein
MASRRRPQSERGELGWITSRPRSVCPTAVTGVLVTALAGCSTIGSAIGNHPGGDPRGEVLQSLEAVTKVLPAGIQIVRSLTLDAKWSEACPDNPSGRSGWGPVLSGSWFNSQSNQAALVSQFTASVGARGWRQVSPKDDSAWQFKPVAEWTKRAPEANCAVIGLESEPEAGAPGNWLFQGKGKVPGYALPGC